MDKALSILLKPFSLLKSREDSFIAETLLAVSLTAIATCWSIQSPALVTEKLNMGTDIKLKQTLTIPPPKESPIPVKSSSASSESIMACPS